MISVVVVNWNSGQFLEQCLAALRRHCPGREIVVVDNGSDDGSADCAAGPDPKLKLIRNAANLGFAAANNIGWRSCAGDLILFLNPDVECLGCSVDIMEQTMSLRPDCWACAGRLLPADAKGSRDAYVRRFPTLSSVAAEQLLLDEIWPGNPWTRRYRMTGEDLDGLQEVEQPAAACLMVRRDRIDDLRGFDEAFRPAWFEDVDLCRRIREAGGKVLLQPAARFRHHGGYSLDRLPYEQFLEHYHANQIRYFEKHHGRSAARRVRRMIIAGLRLRAVLSAFRFRAVTRRHAGTFKAYMAAVRYLSNAGNQEE